MECRCLSSSTPRCGNLKAPRRVSRHFRRGLVRVPMVQPGGEGTMTALGTVELTVPKAARAFAEALGGWGELAAEQRAVLTYLAPLTTDTIVQLSRASGSPTLA